MRILHVISTIDLSAGGPPKSVLDLALSQAIQGEEVAIFTGASKQPIKKESNHPNLKIHFVKEDSFKKALLNYSKENKFDLLHGHSLWSMPIHYMATLGQNRNIPYIITPRGTLHPWALNVKKWKKKIALFLYQRKDLENAACLIATSKIEASYFKEQGLKNPIAIIPNGINLNEFPLTKNKEKNEKKTLLFLSRIHWQKGLSILLEAWQKVDQNLRKKWTLEIAGSGDEKYVESLKEKIKNLGLTNEIKFIGPQFGEAKLSAFQRSDLFVLPSYSENFGIVIAEALACGVPVITTNGTPWAELNSKNAGWTIDIGSQVLSSSLNEAMRLSDNERHIMGVNGRKLIEENYSIEATTNKTIELYEWLLGKKGKPEFVN